MWTSAGMRRSNHHVVAASLSNSLFNVMYPFFFRGAAKTRCETPEPKPKAKSCLHSRKIERRPRLTSSSTSAATMCHPWPSRVRLLVYRPRWLSSACTDLPSLQSESALWIHGYRKNDGGKDRGDGRGGQCSDRRSDLF